MEPYADDRRDTHCQMLVDVGIVLARAHSLDYARAFLDEMRIPQSVISRVLSGNTRRMMHHEPMLTLQVRNPTVPST